MGKWKEHNWDTWSWKRKIWHMIGVFFTLLCLLIMFILVIIFAQWLSTLNPFTELFNVIIKDLIGK